MGAMKRNACHSQGIMSPMSFRRARATAPSCHPGESPAAKLLGVEDVLAPSEPLVRVICTAGFYAISDDFVTAVKIHILGLVRPYGNPTLSNRENLECDKALCCAAGRLPH